FLVGAVHGFALLAGEFDLRARFEGNVRPLPFEGNDVAFFFDRLPSERVGETEEQAFDPAFAEVARRPAAAARDADHLVFGADTPRLARLTGLIKIVNQLRSVLDDLSRFRAFDVLRHGPPLWALPLRREPALR